MSLKPFSLNKAIEVNVSMENPIPKRRDFSLVLLIGDTSSLTTPISQTERVRPYYDTASMRADGFKTEDRLYKAAQFLAKRKKLRVF